MGTVADLKPAELEAEIAWRARVAPVSLASHQQTTVAAAERQANAAQKMAEDAETEMSESRRLADELAVFAAAVALAVDVTSSLDMPATIIERDQRAVERALAMRFHVKQRMA